MDTTNNTLDDCFADYTVYPDTAITDINEQGITLASSEFIDFGACIARFNRTHNCSLRCVGERDYTAPSFTFYTSPRLTVIRFGKRGRLAEFLRKDNAYNRFAALQKRILALGYSTYDMA